MCADDRDQYGEEYSWDETGAFKRLGHGQDSRAEGRLQQMSQGIHVSKDKHKLSII